MKMSWIKGREIPVLIGAIIGFTILFEYHFKVPAVTTFVNYTTAWMTIIAAFALGVGLISLFLIHGRNISRRTEGEWYFSIWWFTVFIIMSAIGLTLGMASSPYTWMFNNLTVAVWKTVSSTTAFFITTAAFRAFRVRNWEAATLLVVAGLVMMGNAPIGGVISPLFPQIGDWIKMVPNIGARRGLLIGVGVSGVALALRTFLGYERGHLGAIEE
jgi:hypothetical protein